jgi:hypothetical protein
MSAARDFFGKPAFEASDPLRLPDRFFLGLAMARGGMTVMKNRGRSDSDKLSQTYDDFIPWLIRVLILNSRMGSERKVYH